MNESPGEPRSPETTSTPLNSWDRVAKLDALGVVLSERRKPHGHWSVDEFFSTGEREVASLLDKCREFGAAPKFGRGLDFGCGVGRLTRAFGFRFSHCVGIDVSSEMILQAREFNKQFANCEFMVNQSRDLPFPSESFDFLSSLIVLQHIKTEQEIVHWITEFVRVLDYGGVVVFQLPDRPSIRRRFQGRRRLWSVLERLGINAGVMYEKLRLSPIPMNGVAPDKVRKAIQKAGGQVIKVEEDSLAGAGYRSYTYYGNKRRA
jgi:SAM-dependent methyltransferase